MRPINAMIINRGNIKRAIYHTESRIWVELLAIRSLCAAGGESLGIANRRAKEIIFIRVC